ncbi:hypothetical protein V6U90_13250 [Micromonospora sp. CPCC 206060]|uniref:hypothetical protein n=1 Tax=Micromonospora sp. CPCC 206060 TaxID=3122406 RepID=UPI002FEEFB12
MGWNTSALFVADHDPLTLLTATTTATAEETDGAEATSGLRHDVVYTARTGQWHELWDPSLEHVMSVPDLAGHRALSVIFSSVTSSYGFSYHDGPTPARRIVYTDGQPVVDDGVPLPVEQGLTFPDWGPDEDFVWAVIEEITGITFDADRRYQVHQLC